MPSQGRNLLIDYEPCLAENKTITKFSWQITHQFLTVLTKSLKVISLEDRIQVAQRNRSDIQHYLGQLYDLQEKVIGNQPANALLTCNIGNPKSTGGIHKVTLNIKLITQNGTFYEYAVWSRFYDRK